MSKAKKRPRVGSSPSVLPARPKQTNVQYTATSQVFGHTLDSIAVEVSLTKKAGTYTLPSMEGDAYLALRRYGLILARYQLLELDKVSVKSNTEQIYLKAANRIVANNRYAYCFDGDDASDGTVFLEPLITALATTILTQPMVCAVASYWGTAAYKQITDAFPTICSEEIMAHNKRHIERLTAQLDSRYSTNEHFRVLVRYVNQVDYSDRKYAVKRYVGLARTIKDCFVQSEIDRQSRIKPKGKSKDEGIQDKKGEPYKGTVRTISGGDRWEDAIIGKPRLEISHSGLMGRRKIATAEGNKIRHLSRIVTDPHKRIFSSRTRSLGGVVVVDCSGSMSLTDEEMAMIMASSSGCTVIAYSSGNQPMPNIYVLARNGRQVRHTPEWAGGNGVDGLALQYALQFKRYNAPMVWVSDLGVTGATGANTVELLNECLDLCNKHNVYIVEDAEQAQSLLGNLQRGRVTKYKPYRKGE